jgi:hypothetical protein
MIAVNASETWEGQDPVDEKIQMMEAQIEKLEASKKKVSFSGNDKKPNAAMEPRPSWLINNVAHNDPKQSKTWNKKTWYWCHKDSGGKCSGKWRLDKLDNCQGKEYWLPVANVPIRPKGSPPSPRRNEWMQQERL